MKFWNHLFIYMAFIFFASIPIFAQDDELDDLDFEYQELSLLGRLDHKPHPKLHPNLLNNFEISVCVIIHL